MLLLRFHHHTRGMRHRPWLLLLLQVLQYDNRTPLQGVLFARPGSQDSEALGLSPGCSCGIITIQEICTTGLGPSTHSRDQYLQTRYHKKRYHLFSLLQDTTSLVKRSAELIHFFPFYLPLCSSSSLLVSLSFFPSTLFLSTYS